MRNFLLIASLISLSSLISASDININPSDLHNKAKGGKFIRIPNPITSGRLRLGLGSTVNSSIISITDLDGQKHRGIISDIWQTISHYWGRNDLNSLELLEDIGFDILSGFNEREKGTVYFYLYNRNQEGSGLIKYGVLNQLRKSFVTGLPVKFLIHGYKMNGFSHFSYLLKEAYMKHGNETNVISVDWRRLAGDHIYFNAAFNTRIVGERIGELLVFMKQNGFVDSYDKVHLIGFSLGAHVAGYSGKYVIKTERQKIGRITGLDPAGPSFAGPNPNNRLDKGDAKFVDVIHTSIGKSGIHQSIGHLDFYPNGGAEQPGCDWERIRDFFLRNCSHERAFYLFLETIRGKKFVGCPCKSWEEYQMGNSCKNCTESSEGAALIGEYCNQSARGDKYLTTGGSFPSAASAKLGDYKIGDYKN